MDDRILTEQLRAGFGSTAKVTTRRPGVIYQVELPAFLADGDAVTLFVKPEPDGRMVVVTDLGQTCMRLSYSREITGSTVDELEKVAMRHGLKFSEGQIFARVPIEHLFTTALALAQTEAEAETHIRARAPKEMAAERFKSAVRQVLREAFGGMAEYDYRNREVDPEGLYPLDALVSNGDAPVGIAVIPSEADAERAVATRLLLEPQLNREFGRVRWVAFPRNIESLPKKTQARVTHSFEVPLPAIIRPGPALSSFLKANFLPT